MTAGRLYHLALEAFHTAQGATFADRCGWRLPETYGDPAVEHAALRGEAAAIDRSDRSRFIVSGTDALTVLRAVFAGHVDELEEGRAMRTVRLDADGTIRDLVLIARTGGIAYVVSGEPGQRDETRQALETAAGNDYDIRVDDRTETTCSVAIAGPGAARVASTHLSESLPPRLDSLHVAAFEFHGFRGTAVRTSDTGEDGFELMLAPAVALHLLETLCANGVPLAGSHVMEVARVEACIPAFTPDLEPGLTPAEADLDTLLEIEGGVGDRILAGLLIEGTGTVVAETPVIEGDTRAGEVRSCVRSYSLDSVAALAVIDKQQGQPGTALVVDGRAATVVAKPFYRRR